MVLGYAVIIVFVVILYYVYSEDSSKFAATASAIRQIWSGGCRLSCRQSERSQLSGLSGLAELPCQAGTSRDDCICDTCPCAMIENLLRTCSPATRMYTIVTNNLLHYYGNLCKSVTEGYEYAGRVLECGASCRRQPQVAETKEYDSSENISFGGQNNEETVATTEKLPKLVRSDNDVSKSISASKKSSIFFKEPLKSDSSNEGADYNRGSSNEGKGSGESISKEKETRGSDETLNSEESPESNCPKCVDEGKTCISNCPRAKKH